MSEVRKVPCEACPYRCDVPSGLWAWDEYEKLRTYEGETWEQAPHAFFCHATPDRLCHGWAVTSGNQDPASLALRVLRMPELPASKVALFASHTEAADHGQRDIDDPEDRAVEQMERLHRKHERLRASSRPATPSRRARPS